MSLCTVCHSKGEDVAVDCWSRQGRGFERRSRSRSIAVMCPVRQSVIHGKIKENRSEKRFLETYRVIMCVRYMQVLLLTAVSKYKRIYIS